VNSNDTMAICLWGGINTKWEPTSISKMGNCPSPRKDKQEAQLPQRDSASATHVFLGSLTDRALHWTPHLLYSYITD